jgi:hypothetical protein
MIKFTGSIDDGGTLYGFGLTEANLNRLVFNQEPIFFDFGYAGLPHLFGLILYFDCPAPEDLSLETVQAAVIPFLDSARGVTVNTLRLMALTKSIVDQFRAVPFWQHSTKIAIAHENDVEMIFSGPDEGAIEKYFVDTGLVTQKTKRTTKGFGKFL